jgi:glycosyltransferase involved in cell wall biosynthesis
LGLADKVTFLGRISNEDVAVLLSNLDVYVALSRSDSESFGVAAVEAMSCGVPVVVAAADGFKEVVPDMVAGYIVPKNDARAAADRISYLLNNRTIAKEMGEAGRKHVLDNYTWTSSVDTMMDIYKIIM